MASKLLFVALVLFAFIAIALCAEKEAPKKDAPKIESPKVETKPDVKKVGINQKIEKMITNPPITKHQNIKLQNTRDIIMTMITIMIMTMITMMKKTIIMEKNHTQNQ